MRHDVSVGLPLAPFISFRRKKAQIALLIFVFNFTFLSIVRLTIEKNWYSNGVFVR
jgi:hypothetical protein